MKKFKLSITSLLYLTGFFCTGIYGQDSNILYPIAEIEQKLEYEDFEIFKIQDARFPQDKVKRATLKWPDGYMQVKWKRAPKGGHASNNAPRYEIAAYQIQKLFLVEPEYVVPPTVGRSMSLDEYLKLGIETQVYPTFKDSVVFFVLQYWLSQVSNKNVYDKGRFKRDSTYARNMQNMNIFSYLIRHNDSNIGNFLISKDSQNGRVFVPDNGLAFDSRESRRGHYWRDLRFKEFPERTIQRLRKISKTTLKNTLGVVAQYEFQKNLLIPVKHTDNLDPEKGVRISEEIVQFGLTQREIDDINDRLIELLKKVDAGKIKLTKSTKTVVPKTNN